MTSKKMARTEDRKEEEPKFYAFLEPEEIDRIIISRIDQCRPKTRPKGTSGRSVKWKEFELELRRQVIIDLFRQGCSDRRVHEEIMSRWHISYESATHYTKDAMESLVEDREGYIKHNREIQIERCEGLLENANADHDHKTAAKALDMLNKIGGLYNEVKTVDVKADIAFKFGEEGEE